MDQILAVERWHAAQPVEHLGETATTGAQLAERRVGPALGVERHRHADRLAVAAVDHRQALEQVVDLILADLDREHLAVDLAAALEVADAVAVQHDPVELERRVGRRVTEALGAAAAGERGGGDERGDQR